MCVEMQIDFKIKGSELFLEPRIGLRRKLLLPQRLWWWPVEAQTPPPPRRVQRLLGPPKLTAKDAKHRVRAP